MVGEVQWSVSVAGEVQQSVVGEVQQSVVWVRCRGSVVGEV